MNARNKLTCLAFAATLAATACAAPTKVLFFFDAEDFVSNRSHDAIRDLGQILSSEGVRGNFALSGYLAFKLVERRRFDVLDELKKHVLGAQTLYHSVHPNLTEATDLADFDEAYKIALAEESEAFGMIKAATGVEKLWCSVFPGNGQSYVGLYVDADAGIPFFGGCSHVYGGAPRKTGDIWYCNQRHLPYHAAFSLENCLLRKYIGEEEIAARLDAATAYGTIVFACHPCTATSVEFWDGVNFRNGNLHPWGEWVEPKRRDPAETAKYYARYRALVRRLKADPRFEITDCEKLSAAQKPRRSVTRAEVPAIRASLARRFGPVDAPASWSVADCFLAAVALLRGETAYAPGRVYGFLERPQSVAAPVRVTAEDLKAAARRMDVSRFLPPSVEVGGTRLGPAEFLFAALETLETGAREVTVAPREQLGDIASELPGLATFRQNADWIYVPEFRDAYLSDRLRLQFWTLRYE